MGVNQTIVGYGLQKKTEVEWFIKDFIEKRQVSWKVDHAKEHRRTESNSM